MRVKLKISTLEFFKNKCFMLRKKLKFRTKNALFRYFGEQIEKDIAIFAISALKVESFMQNVRNFSLGLKLPSSDWHSKKYWHIWNQHPRICRNTKFQAKVQNPKFSTKNTFFGCVWDRIWINYCRIWNVLPQIFLSA